MRRYSSICKHCLHSNIQFESPRKFVDQDDDNGRLLLIEIKKPNLNANLDNESLSKLHQTIGEKRPRKHSDDVILIHVNARYVISNKKKKKKSNNKEMEIF
ncbi:hypothetical protein ABEB36_009164 [Hypothenemus hampei]|uniref:Uncharacterized protein n=1 Tax=Hypothenemus hampei TaxID=57062 RepID=A0ABD1EPT4_HYPHA